MDSNTWYSDKFVVIENWQTMRDYLEEENPICLIFGGGSFMKIDKTYLSDDSITYYTLAGARFFFHTTDVVGVPYRNYLEHHHSIRSRTWVPRKQ